MPQRARAMRAWSRVDRHRVAGAAGAIFAGGTVAAGSIVILSTVLHLRRLSGAVLWNSDAVAPSLLTNSFMTDGLTTSQTILGDITSLQDLLLFAAVGWLPHHESIWRGIPYATFSRGPSASRWRCGRQRGAASRGA